MGLYGLVAHHAMRKPVVHPTLSLPSNVVFITTAIDRPAVVSAYKTALCSYLHS